MEKGYYVAILLVPSLLSTIIIYLLGFILHLKGPNLARLVVTNAFPSIMQKKKKKKKKKNANGTISWQVGDVEIEEGTKLSKITHGVYHLVGTLSAVISLVFFWLLLLEVSYDCDPNEKSKDCFEFNYWGSVGFSDAPINCTSKAVIDGSVEIVCY